MKSLTGVLFFFITSIPIICIFEELLDCVHVHVVTICATKFCSSIPTVLTKAPIKTHSDDKTLTINL